jgi:hypothetical protein
VTGDVGDGGGAGRGGVGGDDQRVRGRTLALFRKGADSEAVLGEGACKRDEGISKKRFLEIPGGPGINDNEAYG